jgi:hypothetical protein
MSDNLYFGGMPTGPDVRLLEEKFPDPQPGDLFTYAQIAKTISIPFEDYDKSTTAIRRIKTVIEAWKKDLIKRSISLGAVRRDGYVVLTASQALDGLLEDVTNKIVRRTTRVRKTASYIKPTDTITAAKRDHIMQISAKIGGAAKEGQKKKIEAPNILQLPARNIGE